MADTILERLKNLSPEIEKISGKVLNYLISREGT
jgi:hypothetical protein